MVYTGSDKEKEGKQKICRYKYKLNICSFKNWTIGKHIKYLSSDVRGIVIHFFVN